MTQVDFYILGTSSNESWLRLACRITEKAVQRDMHVYMHTGGEADARSLDEMLWTFSQGSFIPHRMLSADLTDQCEESVLIGRHDLASLPGETQAGQRWDLLINLTADVPEFFSRYDRVAEVVDADPTRRQTGRDRFRFYRDRGYELNTHNV
ncbi:MAG TPA: DNA polymerase III subunit chi [Gammaproteobacteria bacterium]